MLSYDVILWLKRLPHALLLAGVVVAAPLARRGRIPWVRWTSYRECPVAMADGRSAASGSASEQGEVQGSVGRSSRGARRGSASEQGELQGGVGRSSRGARSRSREGHGAASGRASEQGEHQGSSPPPAGHSPGSPSRRALSPSIDRQHDLCRECSDILSTSHIKAWIRENDSPTEIIYIIRLAAERLERMAGDGRFGSRP